MVKNVVCIKWGTKYGSEYVNRLYRGVARNLAGPFRFVALTDDPSGLDAGIEACPLPETPFDEAAFDARRGGATWRKVGLFQPGLADLRGDVLFLDLDVVITGSLDELFEFRPGQFCVIHDWLEKRRRWLPGRDGLVGNTSVFRYNLDLHGEVYHRMVADQQGVLDSFRIEQQYVSHVLRDRTTFWPGSWVCSFKRQCRPLFPLNHLRSPKQPKDCRVLVFHGYPLPEQAIAGYRKGLVSTTLPATWIAEHWLQGSSTEPAELAAHLDLPSDGLPNTKAA